MRKQTIGLAGALMLCGISMLTGCGARGLEQAYSFQEREAQMTPAAGAGLAVSYTHLTLPTNSLV